MKGGIAATLRSIAVWLLLAAAAGGLVLLVQWRNPERTVEPLANRFLCEGQIAVGASNGPSDIRQVICVDGRTSDNVTSLTMLVMWAICMLVLATFVVLFKRSLAPRRRYRVRSATT